MQPRQLWKLRLLIHELKAKEEEIMELSQLELQARDLAHAGMNAQSISPLIHQGE